MKAHLFFSIITLVFMSCGGATAPKKSANLPGFEISPIPGSEFELATKRNSEKQRIDEEGQLYQGQLSGTWVKYNTDTNNPETISTFVEGKRTGIYLEFNSLGKISKRARYLNDQLDGLYIEYSRNTRKEKEANYKNGQLHGKYKEYNKDEKQIKEIEYKDGKVDGYMRFYNDEGTMTVEYIYKNGEKVSGGAITK